MNLVRTLELAEPFNTLGRRLGVAFPIFCLAMVLILGTAVSNEARAESIPVPNGSFEEVYKPGSTTITADLDGGWTWGVGPDTPMNGAQLAIFSDGTTGPAVDIPGWINALDRPPPYDWTQGSGSVTNQNPAPDGEYYFTANGGGWGHPVSGAVESDAPLAMVEAGMDYTASMLVNGPVLPVVLDLLANDVVITPSSTVDPGAPYAWAEFSRTWNAASLAGHLGESLRIRVGWGPDATGSQSHLDMVSLDAIPEPSTLLLAAVGLLSLVCYGWRRR